MDFILFIYYVTYDMICICLQHCDTQSW